MNHLDRTAAPSEPSTAVAIPPAPLAAVPAGTVPPPPPLPERTSRLKVATVGTGLLCSVSAVVLGLAGQTDVALAVGGVGAAAFAALGGTQVTINIRK